MGQRLDAGSVHGDSVIHVKMLLVSRLVEKKTMGVGVFYNAS